MHSSASFAQASSCAADQPYHCGSSVSTSSRTLASTSTRLVTAGLTVRASCAAGQSHDRIGAQTCSGATPKAGGLRKELARGEVHVVVGTHALFPKETRFARLGLVIIDEQHRFGVRQREELAGKGERPDVLHATATPIPRTLAITLYGGMDISVIPDLPPGRLPVKTSFVPDSKKADLYAYLREQAAAGYQSYIVCPLVEESEYFTQLTPLIDHFSALSEGPLVGLRCALRRPDYSRDRRTRPLRLPVRSPKSPTTIRRG